MYPRYLSRIESALLQRRNVWRGVSGASHYPDPAALRRECLRHDVPEFWSVMVSDDDVSVLIGIGRGQIWHEANWVDLPPWVGLEGQSVEADMRSKVNELQRDRRGKDGDEPAAGHRGGDEPMSHIASRIVQGRVAFRRRHASSVSHPMEGFGALTLVTGKLSNKDNPRARHCCRYTEGHVSAPAGRVTALDSPAASWLTGGPSVGG